MINYTYRPDPTYILYNLFGYFTWCPEQTDPFGTRTRNGLCTGHDDLGPHRVIPGNGTELKILLLHGLHMSGCGMATPLNCPQWFPPDAAMAPVQSDCVCGGSGGPGPDPWWHIGIGHWLPPPMPLWMPLPPLTKHESTAMLSWLSEHCSRCGRGGDDCRE